MTGYVKVLTCAECPTTIEVSLGPLRPRVMGTIPLSDGWILDEREKDGTAYCPEHRAAFLQSEGIEE